MDFGGDLVPADAAGSAACLASRRRASLDGLIRQAACLAFQVWCAERILRILHLRRRAEQLHRIEPGLPTHRRGGDAGQGEGSRLFPEVAGNHHPIFGRVGPPLARPATRWCCCRCSSVAGVCPAVANFPRRPVRSSGRFRRATSRRSGDSETRPVRGFSRIGYSQPGMRSE